MRDDYPEARLDGVGLLMLGLAALLLIGVACAGYVHAPSATDDVGVQQSMAWASWAMVMVSVVGGIIGAVSLFLIYRTLHAARRSAVAAEETVRETRHIGRAQVRAYLSADSLTMKFAPDAVTFVVVIRNSGQSPARDVKLRLHGQLENHSHELGWARMDATLDLPEQPANGTVTRHIGTPATYVAQVADGRFGMGGLLEITYTDVFDEAFDIAVRFGGSWASQNATDAGKMQLNVPPPARRGNRLFWEE